MICQIKSFLVASLDGLCRLRPSSFDMPVKQHGLLRSGGIDENQIHSGIAKPLNRSVMDDALISLSPISERVRITLLITLLQSHDATMCHLIKDSVLRGVVVQP